MTQLKEDQIQSVIKFFQERFDHDPEEIVFAPGRANLIGEHTDYHEGFVLSFALPYGTVVAARDLPKGASSVVVSKEFPESEVIFQIDQDFSPDLHPSWASYLLKIIRQYRANLSPGTAFEAAISSNVPFGAGLSSSASLE